MTARTLMILGTSSSAGKSLITTAFCHYYASRGVSVAPFKAQNMSNNAAVCPDGGEIGRAQAVQAKAAGLQPTVDMNPVLIKPEADSRAQVIVRGKPWKSLQARDYYPVKEELWAIVTRSLDKLREEYDLVIMEGAGSPAELNLKENDIVNMAVARYARAPVFLVGDIDRGGIFAQLLGTHWLLPPGEQKLVKGFLVNKFRGDSSLFTDGITILEAKGGVPVVGVMPYHHDLQIPEEDSVALENLAPVSIAFHEKVDIAVIHLPLISNFDDFDPLAREPNLQVRYVRHPGQLGDPAAVIIPGTKSTIKDLIWLQETGWAKSIRDYAQAGGHVVGICGGYQMLGKEVRDPEGVESDHRQRQGLGLLSIETAFLEKKDTYQARAVVADGPRWLDTADPGLLSGYEIHMGKTSGKTGWLTIVERSGREVEVPDGAVSEDGRIWGTYLHGLFANEGFRRAWLESLGWKAPAGEVAGRDPFQASLQELTISLEKNLDMEYVEKVIWER